ncbi:hypothetical protein [Mumia sp. DW29H23]|uniref:hypothetical protein n=1 Tax=Mumia sp. DW29H23 TaxID=3421241 RepID=UPI003D69F192
MSPDDPRSLVADPPYDLGVRARPVSHVHWIRDFEASTCTAVCTCGLRLRDLPDDLLRVPGHLDPTLWQPTSLVLGFAPPEADWWSDEVLPSDAPWVRAHCQTCDQDEGPYPAETVERPSDIHLCRLDPDDWVY